MSSWLHIVCPAIKELVLPIVKPAQYWAEHERGRETMCGSGIHNENAMPAAHTESLCQKWELNLFKRGILKRKVRPKGCTKHLAGRNSGQQDILCGL